MEYTFKDDSARIAKQGLEGEFDNAIENAKEHIEGLLKTACEYKRDSKAFLSVAKEIDNWYAEFQQLQSDLIKVIASKEVKIIMK